MSDDTPYRASGPQQQVAPHSIPPQNSFAPHPSQPPLMPAPVDVRAITTRPGPGAPPNQNHGQSIPPQNYNPSSIPPQNYNPNSIPPQNQARGSTPPAGYSMPPPQQRASTEPPTVQSRSPKARAPSRGATPPSGTPSHRGRAQTPAESVAAAPSGRRWGLIIFVLLIDIGLAASGAWMLSQGLAN